MADSLKSILLVDDDPDDVFLIRDALSDIIDTNYDITVSNDPEAALDILRENTFDIILSDYRLGATTGVDLIKDVRSRRIATPIILLTGMSEREIDDQALKAGASDYVNKSTLSGPMLDRAMRYAVANARRQELLSTVLANVEAAICVIEDDNSPKIWNGEFSALAKKHFDKETEEKSVHKFLDKYGSLTSQELVDEIGHERKMTTLPDGRQVIMLQDVSEHIAALREREEAELKAAHQAKHCFMTGLPNRLAFTETLEKAIEEQRSITLLNIDLDKFKTFNDVYGHPFGDALLMQVSERLRKCCREDDFLARVGGDEFVAIQTCDANGERSHKLEDEIVDCLVPDIVIENRRISMSASIGVASFPAHGKTVEDLLGNADIAMYRAKSENGSHVEYYSETLDRAVRERRRLTNDLQIAIREGQLDVYFQPQFHLKTNELIGCEALARWIHPDDGPIRPDIFIEMAEDCGLIEDLGKLILRKACTLANEWPSPIKVAVNISGVQVRHTELVNDVQTILLETGLLPKRLELEVTETVLIDDFEFALHVLRGIKNLGVGLAMDDFGTGFSSLSSLISFPFDKLKIDRSFVMDMDKREQLKSVVRTCIGLGQNLDLKIVAEGVEQESHINFLRAEGCDEIQGYFVGKPMPQAHFLEFMDDHAKGRVTAEQVTGKSAKVA